MLDALLKSSSFALLSQVHKLDSATWKKVTVVPIDIADRSQVSAAVSRSSFCQLLCHSATTVINCDQKVSNGDVVFGAPARTDVLVAL